MDSFKRFRHPDVSDRTIKTNGLILRAGEAPLSSCGDVSIHFHGRKSTRALWKTLCQGIIRLACQARRVWYVVKRPSRLPPFPEEFSSVLVSPEEREGMKGWMQEHLYSDEG